MADAADAKAAMPVHIPLAQALDFTGLFEIRTCLFLLCSSDFSDRASEDDLPYEMPE